MGTVMAIYIICLIVGAGFVLLSFLISGVFGGGMDHMDGGDLSADMAGHGELHFSPLSPTVLSFFLASFGAAGIFLHQYAGLAPLLEVPAALLAGMLFALLFGYVYFRVISVLQMSSHLRTEDAIGREAEVTVTIPARGVGQISYILGGRKTAPARAVDDSEIPARSVVRIARIVGTTYYVERIP
jgi:membrane protein implicated in regulation of membrane protease activity